MAARAPPSTYRAGGVDVTGAVQAGTFSIGPLEPGASSTFQVKVTAATAPAAGARHRVDVTVRSTDNPVAVDVVRARVSRA